MRKYVLRRLSLFALVAQWIEHPPPKGRVTRSIRVEGANLGLTIKHAYTGDIFLTCVAMNAP